MASELSKLHLERCSGLVKLNDGERRLLVGVCKGSVISVQSSQGPANLGNLLDVLDSPTATFEFSSNDSDLDPSEGTELEVLLIHHARRRALRG